MTGLETLRRSGPITCTDDQVRRASPPSLETPAPSCAPPGPRDPACPNPKCNPASRQSHRCATYLVNGQTSHTTTPQTPSATTSAHHPVARLSRPEFSLSFLDGSAAWRGLIVVYGGCSTSSCSHGTWLCIDRALKPRCTSRVQLYIHALCLCPRPPCSLT
jgi:hypothetical protein